MIYGSSSTKRKTRSLPTLVKPITYDTVYNSNGSINTQNAVGAYTLRTGSEEIIYSTKPKSLRTQANFCRHIKKSFGVDTWTINTGTATGPNPDGTYNFTSADQYSIGASSTAWTNLGMNIPDGYGEGILGLYGQGYINDAFYALKPDLTSLSIPNFLLELDDLPRMFQLWKSKFSVLVNAARARLNWSFGWKPFLGDLESIKSVLFSVYEQCKEWNRKAGELIHKSMSFSPASSNASGVITWPPASAHKAYWSGDFNGKVTAHLVFKTLKIPELETMEGVLRVYLDALGFELNPRIIWDALPFSFVLDWFFEVGGWLQRFKKDTLELPVVLVDSYLQYKQGLRCETYWERSAADGLYIPSPRSKALLQDEYLFLRLPIFPDESAATAAGWKIPGRNQLINLFSLATALRAK